MNENSNSPSVKKKPSVTVKNVLRTLTFCCAILFFCPMFMVSCSDSGWGVDTDLMKVSAITAIKGISGMGETLVQPHPILVLCLLLPVAAIILLFIKKSQINRLQHLFAELQQWILLSGSFSERQLKNLPRIASVSLRQRDGMCSTLS